jgi:hypothetical protein
MPKKLLGQALSPGIRRDIISSPETHLSWSSQCFFILSSTNTPGKLPGVWWTNPTQFCNPEPLNGREGGDEIVERLDVPEGKEYLFILKDSFGDGIMSPVFLNLSYDGYMWGTPDMVIEKVEDFTPGKKRVVKFTARKFDAAKLTNW